MGERAVCVARSSQNCNYGTSCSEGVPNDGIFREGNKLQNFEDKEGSYQGKSPRSLYCRVAKDRSERRSRAASVQRGLVEPNLACSLNLCVLCVLLWPLNRLQKSFPIGAE